MLLISIILLLGLFLGYRNRKKPFSSETYSTSGGLFVILAWLFGTYALIAIYLVLVSATKVYSVGMVEYDRKEIVALSTGSSINGSFFLLSGNIDDAPYYFFYYEKEDGGKQFDKVSSYKAVLYEEPSIMTPYIVKIGEKYVLGEVSDTEDLLFFPRFLVQEITSWGSNLENHVRINFIEHHLHIPLGTVKQKMEVDVDKF